MINTPKTLTTNDSVELGRWGNNRGVVVVQGDFGAGTFELEFSLDEGTTWDALSSDTQFSSAGGATFVVTKNTELRGTLSGATSPSIVFSVEQYE